MLYKEGRKELLVDDDKYYYSIQSLDYNSDYGCRLIIKFDTKTYHVETKDKSVFTQEYIKEIIRRHNERSHD